MAYILIDDYSLRIGVEHLKEILAQATEQTGLDQDKVRDNAERWARSVIKSYLVSQYDIDTEFAKDGSAVTDLRNLQILQVLIDLVLCTLHKTINPRDIPEHIQNGCDSAKTWLEEARDAKIVVDLPAAEVPPGPDTQVYPTTFLDSQRKFVSKPFQDKQLSDATDLTA